MMRPLGDKLLLELDPLPKLTDYGLHLPDQDTIKYCRRCDARQERLAEVPCLPTEEYRYSRCGRKIELAETHFTHDIASVHADIVTTRSRWGRILRTGPQVRSLREGARVLVASFAGGSDDDVRLVRETEVLALEVA